MYRNNVFDIIIRLENLQTRFRIINLVILTEGHFYRSYLEGIIIFPKNVKHIIFKEFEVKNEKLHK